MSRDLRVMRAVQDALLENGRRVANGCSTRWIHGFVMAACAGIAVTLASAGLSLAGEAIVKIDPADAKPVPPAQKDAASRANVGGMRRFESEGAGVSGITFSRDGRRALSGCVDGAVSLWDVATGRRLRQFVGHKAEVRGVAFSPDGRRAYTAGFDKTVRIWDAETGKELKRLEGHGEGINRLAVSSDGRRAASASWDKTVRIWDLGRNVELKRIDGHGDQVFGVAFSPDGRRLASGSWDRTVRLWDVASGKEIRKLEGHTAQVSDVAYSTDGRRVLSGAADGTMRLWDTETGREVAQFQVGADTGWAVALAPDGRRALSVRNHDVLLWDVASTSVIQTLTGHSDQVKGLAFAPDGRTALSCSQDRTLRLWDVAAVGRPAPPDAALARPREPRDRAKAADPSSADERLAKAAALSPARNSADVANRRKKYADFEDALRAAAGAFPIVAVGFEDEPVGFTKLTLNSRNHGLDAVRFKVPANAPAYEMDWEFVVPARENKERDVTGWYITAMAGPVRGFTDYQFKHDDPIDGIELRHHFHVSQTLRGGRLKAGAEYLIWFGFKERTAAMPVYVKINLRPTPSDVIEYVKTSEAAQLKRIDVPDLVSGLDRTPDGRQAIVGCGSAVLVIDLESGEVVTPLNAASGSVRSLAVSPDGRLVAVARDDKIVHLQELPSGKEVRALVGHTEPLRDVVFAPDGNSVLSAAEDRTLRLWSVSTGKEIRKIEGHTDQVLCVRFSPDGRRFVSGASIQDPVGRVWDAQTGEVLARLVGNTEAIYAVAFAPDGKTVLTVGEDRMIRQFDATSGRLMRRVRLEMSGNPHGVAFVPQNERCAITTTEDPAIVFWDPLTGREIAHFEGPSASATRLAVSSDGRSALVAYDDRTLRVWRAPGDIRPAGPLPQLPTQADLNYLKSVARDLKAETPEELADVTRLDLDDKATDAGLAHVVRLMNLESFSIDPSADFHGEGLVHLKGLARLKRLDLGFTEIDDADLVHIRGMTTLTDLTLWHTRVTDAGLASLQRLTNLEDLHLTSTRVRGPGLKWLKGMTRLRELRLGSDRGDPTSAINDSALVALKGLTSLELLALEDLSITDAGLGSLAGLTSLRALFLHHTRIGDRGLARLKPLTRLETLSLADTRVTDSGLVHLEALRNLTSLVLRKTRVTDSGLAKLKALPRVRHLDLAYTTISDVGLARLAEFPALEGIELEETKITDVGLRHLGALKTLRGVTTRDTKVTDAAAEQLEKSRRELRVEN